mmetsp:Transcript_44996/g.119259  ORF Transcript_44996/g.119259 Transcript_44996/m.119259 type:complete len:204 (-) Transcript_44996:159-770(-)
MLGCAPPVTHNKHVPRIDLLDHVLQEDTSPMNMTSVSQGPVVGQIIVRVEGVRPNEVERVSRQDFVVYFLRRALPATSQSRNPTADSCDEVAMLALTTVMIVTTGSGTATTQTSVAITVVPPTSVIVLAVPSSEVLAKRTLVSSPELGVGGVNLLAAVSVLTRDTAVALSHHKQHAQLSFPDMAVRWMTSQLRRCRKRMTPRM